MIDALKNVANQFVGGGTLVKTVPQLALMLSDRKIGSFVWGNEPNGPQIYTQISSSDWGGQNLEELIVAADGVISASINYLTDRFVSPPTQVVLAVPFSWVDRTGLLKEKSLLLANLTRRLGYTAVGFVVIPEAIANFLKESRGVTSSLSVQLEENDEYVTLIRQGNVVNSTRVNRSDDIASDIEEGMARVDDHQPFPPVVYLSGNGDLGEIKQKLINYPWPDTYQVNKPSFLQIPKFEICQSDFESTALISQVTGKTITPHQPLPTKLVDEEKLTDLDQTVPAEVDIPETLPPKIDYIGELTLSPQDFGFSTRWIPSSAKLKPSDKPLPALGQSDESVNPTAQQASISNTVQNSVPLVEPSGANHNSILLTGRKLLPRVPLKLLFTIIVILVVLPLSLWFVYQKTTAVELDLIVNSQKQAHQIEVTFSDKVNEIDSEKLIIPLSLVQADVVGSGQGEVQGVKTVGDPAKGEVTIYNGTTVTKTITKNSIIKSSTGLKFSLDETITIPAKTTDFSSTPPIDKWGEKKVLVTANKFGAEYNLAANTTFSFDNIATSSSWLIKNPVAFANGSSRQVQAVDANDRKILEEKVLTELTKQAEEKLNEKVGSQGKLLKDSIKVKTKTDRFDKQIGEEAEAIKLESSVVFTGQYYSPDALYTIINSKLASLVPEGYQQKPNLGEFKLTAVNPPKNIYRAETTVEYIPEIDLTALALELRGKNTAAVETILSEIDKVDGYTSVFKPKLLSFLKRYPLNVDKIIITLTPK